VRLMANGRVRVQTATHEIGNGIYTVLAQLAAERLAVPLSIVTVEVGDSALPPAPVAGGSNSTASTCSAVLKACDAIRAKLFHAASTNEGALAGRSPAELNLTGGRAGASAGAVETTADRSKWAGAVASRESA